MAHNEVSYDANFYARNSSFSQSSSRFVAPLVLDFWPSRSIVDFGCGRGEWLSAFAALGVNRILGFEGHPPIELQIPETSYRQVDLRKKIPLDERFDLAMCLEVAEHLPHSQSRSLVARLTAASDVVLFSAAIPGQGGEGHINEQWPNYWKKRFEDEGFARLDPFRRKIWQSSEVAWWFQQNLFLFAKRDLVNRNSKLLNELKNAQTNSLELVHADVLDHYRNPSGLLRTLPSIIWRRIVRP